MVSLGTFISHFPINLKIDDVARWTALSLGTIPIPLGCWCMVIQQKSLETAAYSPLVYKKECGEEVAV